MVKKKVMVYMEPGLHEKIRELAARLDRSVNWVINDTVKNGIMVAAQFLQGEKEGEKG